MNQGAATTGVKKGTGVGAGHVVVVGNEKGGSGKTTTAMHLAVALMHLGFKVSTIDVDGRQRSLTRYVENRAAFADANGLDLPRPDHRLVRRSPRDSATDAAAEEREVFLASLAEAMKADFVVIDCPGSDGWLPRLAHIQADTLVTPLNDSFIDLDPLIEMKPGTLDPEKLGVYLEMIWEQRQERRRQKRPGLDWVVVRNRLSALADRNKRALADVLAKLAPVIGFRVAPGIGERVIFRQLFLDGLTALDVGLPGVPVVATASHAAARREILGLVRALWLPRVDAKLDAMA
ncbi:MAG: AAA family ATPase [Alphaproteobacteria bacterium]|nr:AAA family ATPase [Alphaproteobacteria bacterium]